MRMTINPHAFGAQALQLIQAEAARTPVDVVLYLDRLDFYRVEPVDHSVRASMPQFFVSCPPKRQRIGPCPKAARQ